MYKEYGWNDTEVVSTGFIYPKLKKALLEKGSKCILDLGSGNGEIANKLISDGFSVYGVDASVQGVKIANEYNPNHFFAMNFESDDLPKELRDIQFDTIISTEVIEHLYDPDSYIKLCRKILKNKGNIILTTPYHGYLKNLVLSVAGKWDAHFSPLWTGGHIKFWSFKTLKKLLDQNEFVVEEFIGCGRIHWLWKSMMIKARCIELSEEV